MQSEFYETSVTYKYKCLAVSELDEDELLVTDNFFDLALCAARRVLTRTVLLTILVGIKIQRSVFYAIRNVHQF